jgi:hypothetical protein
MKMNKQKLSVNLPAVLCGSEERVFKNRLPRRIFGLKREEVMASW